MEDRRIPVEELIDFPTRFSFKAIGHHTREFAPAAFRVVREILGDDRGVELRTRLSRQAAYISATVTARVDSAEELRTVYAALWKLEGVITVL
ncbi:DUF493 domain-containing protein [Deferrisoma palaeochoriense]